MKRYKCHKVVEAEKIAAFRGLAIEAVVLESGEELEVPKDWGPKVKGQDPTDNGYLVRYADGYLSWSPTKAFEEGYALEDNEDLVSLELLASAIRKLVPARLLEELQPILDAEEERRRR